MKNFYDYLEMINNKDDMSAISALVTNRTKHNNINPEQQKNRQEKDQEFINLSSTILETLENNKKKLENALKELKKNFSTFENFLNTKVSFYVMKSDEKVIFQPGILGDCFKPKTIKSIKNSENIETVIDNILEFYHENLTEIYRYKNMLYGSYSKDFPQYKDVFNKKVDSKEKIKVFLENLK